MRYMAPYNKNKCGMHSYTDGKDNEQYLYTQFEVYNCFRVFPSFDQPGLKAKMTLTVMCPREWEAVSNGIETRYNYELDSDEYGKGKGEGSRVIEKNEIGWMLDFYDQGSEKISIATYEQTPKISPYLYALCAGPYKKWEDFDS